VSAAAFEASKFGPVFGPLLSVERLPDLGPGRPDETHRAKLKAAERDGFAHLNVRQPLAAKAFLAGLWLFFDFLDESHEISQSLPDEWGAYWHGIMHRREPDAWNSKYWFRRIGDNPIAVELKAAAEGLGYDYWDPFALVDDCERCRDTGSVEERSLRVVQLTEIRLLLQHDLIAATEG
jgi:hypothetical protein